MAAEGAVPRGVALRTGQPLAAIAADASACLNWLAKSQPDLDMARAALAGIVSDSLRAGEVIHRIRQLATKSDPQRTQLQLNDVIHEVVPLVRRELHDHDVSLRLDLTPGTPAVVGDRVQLQQVLINLVINGIEAMAGVADRARELVIRSRRQGNDEALVTVEDAGVGLDRESTNQLFTACRKISVQSLSGTFGWSSFRLDDRLEARQRRRRIHPVEGPAITTSRKTPRSAPISAEVFDAWPRPFVTPPFQRASQSQDPKPKR